MGDLEDTFTKQEIQAGYVTSGRDVLARQQQIMAQQAAAAFGSGTGTRKKVGGGGPSGTGKASASPVFPPPSFDEPIKKVRAQSAILRQGGHMQHSAHGMGVNGAPSAASIVAGIGVAPAAPPAPHTMLTPLNPLKRAGSMPLTGKTAAVAAAGAASLPLTGMTKQPPQPLVGGASDLTPAESLALQEQRKEAALAQQQQQQMIQAQTAKQKQKELQQQQQQQQSSSQPGSPSHSSIGSASAKGQVPAINGSSSAKPISSDLSGPPIGAISGSSLNMGATLIGGYSGNLGGTSIGEPAAPAASSILQFGGSGILGGQPLSLGSDDGKNGVIGGSSLAPSGFGLGLLSTESSSSGVDKWGAAGGGSSFGGSGALWGGDAEPTSRPTPIGPASRGGSSIGAPSGDVGGMSLFGTNQSSYASGSSALASMLGIELPTGSGSLRENSAAFSGGNVVQAPIGAVGASVGGLNTNNNGAIGAIGASKPINMLQPIGAPSSSQVVGGLGGGGISIGGFSSGGNSDMALLQSLLPGVNITSGNAYRPAAPQQNQYQQQQVQQPVGVGGLNSAQWGGANNSASAQQQQEQQRTSNIW